MAAKRNICIFADMKLFKKQNPHSPDSHMETEANIVKCLNCGTQYTGKFCPQCGQKASTKRLKIREIVADFAGSVIGGDNRFLNTCLGLCSRPGHMVREYLQGHRYRYYNPLQTLVWIVSVYAVLSYFLGSDLLDMNKIVDEQVEIDKEVTQGTFWILFKKCWHFIADNKLNYMLFSVCFAYIPYHFAFRKYKILRPDKAELPLNYTEMFYVLVYQSCIEMLFAIPILPFCLIKGSENILTQINNLADVIITVFVFKQFYGISWWKSIKRCIVAFLMLLILVFVLIIVAIVLFLLIYGLIYGIKEMVK